MKINFRQGIVRYQTDVYAQPAFLQKSTLNSQFIDLIVSPDPTIIVFAHRGANYLFEEAKTVANAWGPFVGTTTQYLYWDLDLLTGILTRGATTLPPIYSGTAPKNMPTGQHWFDTSNTLMQVWNGTAWIEKIRVFAATYSSSSVIKPFPLGSQAGLVQTIDAGNLVLDEYNKPLRQSNGTFVTTTTTMAIVGLATKKVKFETEVLQLMATEYIPKFSLVQAMAGRKCSLARSSDKMSRVSGICMEDMYQGEISVIVPNGLVRYEGWNWPIQRINRPIFCGPTGQLTLSPPTTGVLQQVGVVYDTDAVFMNIFPPIMLERPDDTDVPVPPIGAPIADFTVQPYVLTGPAPFTVKFVSTSLNNPTTFEWDFDNNGTLDASTASPTFIYSTPGTYSVRLKATNGAGSNEMTKTNFITVYDASQTTGLTNLDVNLYGPTQIRPSNEFQVTLNVVNTGLLTATNVQRTFSVSDVRGQQVPVSRLPLGSIVARIQNRTVVTLPQILSMISGSSISVSFTVTAPNVAGTINMDASVFSPEIDVETGDNTTSLSVISRV